MSWPADWDARVSGDACPMCREGRPEETPFGIRVFAGRYCDAYVGTRAAQPGYVCAIWRGRHVTDLGELTLEELAGYWVEVTTVAAAMREHFRARKMNYEVLGNDQPHVHTHITARFAVHDIAPGTRLPAHRDVDLSLDEVMTDVIALRRLLASSGPAAH